MKRSIPKTFGRIRLINLLFWVGLCLNVAGIVAGLSAGTWSTLPIGLMIAGCLCFGLWLVSRWRLNTHHTGSWWRGRSFQAGTNALLSTLAVIIIVGLINLLATRYSAQLDLTENKVFSLAPQTQAVVKALGEKLSIWVFDDNPPPQHRTLLEQYQRLNPDRFSFKFVDPQVEVGLTEKYEVRTAGTVVLKAGDRTKTLQFDLKEVNLTPEIVSLVGQQPNAYIVQGQGELPIAGEQANLSEAVAALQREGFKTDLWSLVEKKQVPADADVLIIASPQRKYGEAEIKLLEDYLSTGGHVLLLLDPDTDHGLDAFLKTWGITLDNRLVLDATRQLVGLGPAVPLVFDYNPHPITEGFALASYFPKTQAMQIEKLEKQEAIEFLSTGPNSWAEADPENEQLEFNPDRDSQGPLTIGVAIQRPVSSSQSSASEADQSLSETGEAATDPSPSPQVSTPPEQPSGQDQPSVPPVDKEKQPKKPPQPEARLVVIGDADFAISGFFSDPRVANGDVFLNSVTWLSSDQAQPALSIRPKETTNRQLVLDVQRQQQLFLLGVLLPVGAVAAAVALWWQRR